MILEIDAGNTSLKWRWRGAAANSVREPAQLHAALAGGRTPDEVLICNVRGAEFAGELVAWTRREWGLPARFAKVARECGGVRIQYADPARLGADRWLAMLAGFRMSRGMGCLIVDSGTALTIDAVDAGGLHLGGYIMPGLASLRAAPLRNTAIRLPPADSAGDGGGKASVELGNDTAAALGNGALFMLCSTVRAAIARFRRGGNDAARLILTGGDAPLLQRQLGLDEAAVAPELVLDGLAIGCGETED